MSESRTLRVCILSEFCYPDNDSGTGKAISDIARSLADDHGMDVEMVTGARLYSNGKPLKKSENWDGIPIRRVSYPDWNRSGVAKRSICNVILSIKAGIKLLFSRKYDAILVTTAPPFMPMAARIVNIFRRTPYAYLLYDLEPDRALRLGAVESQALPTKLLSKAQSKWLNRSAQVLAIGRCMKALVETNYGVQPEKVRVVPVGADDRLMHFAPYAPDASRKFRLLYSGNLGRYHDFDSLLDSAKILGPENFEFIIVGRGARRPHVDKRISEEKITNVTTMDFQSLPEYERLLASADACFVTMEKGIEGTCVPSKFYSIMAAGRVTVAAASADSELAYALAEHDCGVLVSPGEEGELTQALRALKKDVAKTKQMSDNARKAFLDRYTTKKTVASIYQALGFVANEPVRIEREVKVEETPLVTVGAPRE